jgi:hypothetical protein
MPSKVITTEIISNKIYFIRSRKIMFDRDLAALYGVTTGNLNKAVKRNVERFPADFMFQLSPGEAESSRFQFGSLKRGKNYKYLPYAFTEQGIAMLSSVLRSKRAIEVNIVIMRTFVRIREILVSHKELALKLNEMEQKLAKHDKEILAILQVIRRLIMEEEKPKTKIGFHSG